MNQQEAEHKDAEFLKGIAAGDTRIIRKVYGQYFNSIVQYILKNSGTIDDARDIFQDGMMIIYEKLQQPDFKLQYGLHTYLYTICRNTWLKKIKNKLDIGVPLPPNLELIEEDSFEKEIIWRQKERLYRAKLKELGEGCQRVLKMALSGISMEKIAQTMGYAGAGYAKKRKYKCKKQLLNLIQNDPQFSTLKML